MRKIAVAAVAFAALVAMALPAQADGFQWFRNGVTNHTVSFSTTGTGLVTARATVEDADGAGVTITLRGPTTCDYKRCDKHRPLTEHVCTVTSYPGAGRGCGFTEGPAGAWTVTVVSTSGTVDRAWVTVNADHLDAGSI